MSIYNYFALAVIGLGSLSANELTLEQQDLVDYTYHAEGDIALHTTAKKKKEATPAKATPVASVPLLPNHPCPDDWRLSAAFLYLLPTFDDTYFVIESDATTTYPNGRRKQSDFGFNPGFRVGAEYALCDTHRDFQFFYSQISTAQHKLVSGEHLWGTLGRPDLGSVYEDYTGTASAALYLLYQRADFNFSQQVLNSYGMVFYIQPGLEYAYLRLHEQYAYNVTGSTVIGSVDEYSKAWGLGPQIGLAFDYNFYQSAPSCSVTHAFGLASLFSGSILMGQSKVENTQILGDTFIVDVDDQTTWRTIPALHARVGFDYQVRGSWAVASFGIGYEFNTYVRGLSRTSYQDDVSDGICTTDYYNFDIQGMYLSGAFSF